MPVQLERRIRLPPDARSAGRARRMLQDALAEPDIGLKGDDGDLVDTAVLLASELCENAVIRAGTEFEVVLTVDAAALTVAVTDRGAGPLESHLAQPRRRYGRAASHGRGLEMVQRLATTWGTRHESDGRHVIWFSLALEPGAAPAALVPPPVGERVWSEAEQARRLLHVPSELVERLQPMELVAELLRRLCELLDADSARVDVDEGDGRGPREIARAGTVAAAAALGGTSVDVALPLTAPLRGRLQGRTGPARPGWARIGCATSPS